MKLPEVLQKVFVNPTAPISVLTAYDALTARLAVMAGVDALLVGDSLGTTVQGNDFTKPVTLDQMEYHTSMVARHAGPLPVVADLPFQTYTNPDQALDSARKLLNCGAHAVKFEGYFPEISRAFTRENIPLMGHLGLLPQTALNYQVRGKTEPESQVILEDAMGLEKDGAFSIVLECIPRGLGEKVQKVLGIPVIGIGAGSSTAGQVLVIYDLLRFIPGDKRARFVPTRYQNGGLVLKNILETWVKDVKTGAYPSLDETYG